MSSTRASEIAARLSHPDDKPYEAWLLQQDPMMFQVTQFWREVDAMSERKVANMLRLNFTSVRGLRTAVRCKICCSWGVDVTCSVTGPRDVPRHRRLGYWPMMHLSETHNERLRSLLNRGVELFNIVSNISIYLQLSNYEAFINPLYDGSLYLFFT